MKNNKKILITGASGFIGGRIAEVLYLTKYAPFVAGIRRWASAARIARFPIEIKKMDLLVKEEIEKGFDDEVDVIIHCAYGNDGTTTVGTRNLLEVAEQKKIKHFIYLSTIEVYKHPEGIVTEDYPSGKTGNPYGDSKFEAEEICNEFMRKGVPITIFRLPIVYGPFARNWTVNMGLQLLQGQLGIIEGYGEGICNLIYVDDVVRVILLSLNKTKVFNKTYNVNGPKTLTWNEYFQIFGNFLGIDSLKVINKENVTLKSYFYKPIRLIGGYIRNHHLDLVKKLAEHSEFFNHILRRTEKSLKNSLSKEELELMKRKLILSHEKIKSEMGFEPIVSPEYGIRLSAEWLKTMGADKNFLNFKII